MKPVTQTRTGIPTGNCTEACIASIMEVDLGEVPSLWDPETGDHHTASQWSQVYAWLRSRGRMMVYGDFDPVGLPAPFAAVYPWAAHHWIAHLGWGGFHLLAGPNPDGVPHWVVGHGGRLVWDPNPRSRGIVMADGLALLAPLDWLPPDMQGWPAIAIPQPAAWDPR